MCLCVYITYILYYCVCLCVCVCVQSGGVGCRGECGHEPGGASAAAAQEPSAEYCGSWSQRCHGCQ